MYLPRACAAALLSAVIATAASAQESGGAAPTTPRAEETSTGYAFRINSRATLIERVVLAPADSVWAVLPEVFRELGITPQIVGEGGRTMGNQRVTARRVAGERTDRFLRCGNQGSGASAVSALRIQLSVVTTVRAEDGGSRLYTEVSGNAASVEGSGGTFLCVSTGLLERKLGDAVMARFLRR